MTASPPTPRPPALGSRSATETEPEPWPHADGERLRAAAEQLASCALAGELSGRPWLDLLELTTARGEAVAAALAQQGSDELELTGRTDRRRVEREQAERAKRAQRRAAD